MLTKTQVLKNLLKNAGYREIYLINKNSNIDTIKKIQNGVYEFRGIQFTYGLVGYEDFTIIG